jgi:hypothetical protein
MVNTSCIPHSGLIKQLLELVDRSLPLLRYLQLFFSAFLRGLAAPRLALLLNDHPVEAKTPPKIIFEWLRHILIILYALTMSSATSGVLKNNSVIIPSIYPQGVFGLAETMIHHFATAIRTRVRLPRIRIVRHFCE